MEKLIAKNPTAYHNYSIESTIEAGIVLTGTEIKSIRTGKINLKDTYVNIKDGEVFVYGMHISPYEFGNIYNKDPLRTRKLLMNRREIDRLYGMIKQKGISLVPTKMYFKGNKVKLEVGIGKGKKLFDKREDMAKKDAERRIAAWTLTDLSKVASAKCETLPNGNYKITIVMVDEDTPKKEGSMLGQVTGALLYWEDIETTLTTDSTVTAILKEFDNIHVVYKAYTIVAEMTPDGKFVTLDHLADVDINIGHIKVLAFSK